MRARAFIVPKGAESENDCQDRFSINAATGSVAVSDGMSQSLFPKYWAEILADRYTSERDWFPSHENVRALSQIWREMVEARLEAMRRNGINTWRTENMLADGMSAGATLVGVRTTDTGWECNVLGDSCLVVVKEDRIDDIHSSMDTGSFGNYPDYYDSDPAKPGKGEVATFDGHWAKGLTLLLVSDPLAAYLASVLLSMILAFFFPWILSLAERSPRIERVTAAVTDRLMRRAEDITARTRSAGEREKKNALLFAVYAFVAVPLPMTGVWSGALLSAMLRSDRGRTIFALAAGNFTAGGIVLAVALLAGDHAALVFRIFLIAAIGMILLAFVRSWIERPRSDSHDE